MIERKTVYVTTDDKEFATLADAEAHQARIGFIQAYEKYGSTITYTNYRDEEEDMPAEELAIWVEANRPLVENFYAALDAVKRS